MKIHLGVLGKSNAGERVETGGPPEVKGQPVQTNKVHQGRTLSQRRKYGCRKKDTHWMFM